MGECVNKAGLKSILKTSEVYLVFKDNFMGGFPGAEDKTYILFGVGIGHENYDSVRVAVMENAHKDREIGSLVNHNWLPSAAVLEQRWPRGAAFHVKRNGKWFEPGAVKTDFEQLVEVLIVSEGLTREGAESFAETLWEAAPLLHSAYEHDCNGDMTRAMHKTVATLEAGLTEGAKLFNVDLHFNGDPRGAPIKLKLKNGRSNGFGGEWCVNGDRPDLD